MTTSSRANEMRVQIFDMPLLLDEEVFSYISLIDAALFAAARALFPGTDWFLRYFGELANKTLFTSFRNQRMFQTLVPRSKRPKVKGRQPPVGDLYSEDETAFLLALNKAAVHSVDRSAPPPDVTDFRLFRRTLVECMEGFMQVVGAKVQSGVGRGLSEVAYLKDAETVSRLYDVQEKRPQVAAALARMKAVEDRVGAEGDLLYTSVLGVIHHLRVFLELRSQLCTPYLRKVWSVVREHNIRQQDPRFMALFNWGVTGLTTAVNCFDHSRATSFGRFAEWWIKQRILSYHKASFNLVSQESRHIQVRTRVRTLIRDNGWADLPVAELVTNLSAEMDMDREDIVRILHDDIALSSVVSLDVQFGEDDSRTSVGDMIPTVNADGADKAEGELDQVKAVLRLVDRMPWDHVRLLLISVGQEDALLPYYRPDARNLVRMAIHVVSD